MEVSILACLLPNQWPNRPFVILECDKIDGAFVTNVQYPTLMLKFSKNQSWNYFRQTTLLKNMLVM